MNFPGWLRHRHGRHDRCDKRCKGRRGCTLADLPVGSCRRITGFIPGLSAERRAHLRAYGLLPGAFVHVLQQQPVTVLQIGHTELALEAELACRVCVEERSEVA